MARYLSPQRKVEIVQPPSGKEFDLSVVVPVEDLGELGGSPASGRRDATAAEKPSIWPHVEERIADLVQAHRSTIVFANSRRLAERLCNRLNEIAYERATGEAHARGPLPGRDHGRSPGPRRARPPLLARAHHGSVSKEQRAQVEEDLKAGRLPAVVATSSLELGIDMGAVDLVVQVESPPSVASGLQRVGRAGHQVGAVSTGVVFPKYRGDLVQSAVVTERMREGAIEALRVPSNPLDVLAQQLVAMVAAGHLAGRRAAGPGRAGPRPSPRSPSRRSPPCSTCSPGRYPSDAFAELRPRVVWDRVAGRSRAGRARSGSRSPPAAPSPTAACSASSSPGADPKKGGGRVGELDEEMVYESRVGDVFTLGTTSWRIEDITRDRVLVSPAPGVPGPAAVLEGRPAGPPAGAGPRGGRVPARDRRARAEEDARLRLLAAGLDAWAADNVLAYLDEQRQACGHVPDDRTIVVERFRDELGDWRVVVHSPFGAQVHAPWALALGARLAERYGMDAQVMHADDGIVLRLPDADLMGLDLLDQDPVHGRRTPTFDTRAGARRRRRRRLRQGRGRADRHRPGRRLRAVRLPVPRVRRACPAAAAAQSRQAHPAVAAAPARGPTAPGGRASSAPSRSSWKPSASAFRTSSTCPGLTELMGDIESRRVRLVEVTTPEPSPFARSLLFGYVAQFLYEGDSPLAERRAAALSLDSRLLAELLGQAELRELLDAEVLAELERELQWLTEDRRIKDAEGVADLLRLLGPLTDAELAERGARPAVGGRAGVAPRRAIRVRIAGARPLGGGRGRGPAAGRAGHRAAGRRARGVHRAGQGPARATSSPGTRVRTARSPPPRPPPASAWARPSPTARCTGSPRAGRVVQGEFHPAGIGQEWCDAAVLRRLRRRSLAALRQELEPVPPAALAAFLPQWQHLGGNSLRGIDGLARARRAVPGRARCPPRPWRS